MKRFNYLSLLLLSALLLACQEQPIHTFQDAYDLAKQENKYLWLNLNWGRSGSISKQIHQFQSGTTAPENYIFYQVNLLNPSNTFLNDIFLIENINNTYILNPQGEIVTFGFQEITPESICNQLNTVLKNQPILPEKVREFNSSPKELLQMQNLVLKANMLYIKYPDKADSLNQALDFLDQAINIEPYFYNLYLKSKILKTLQISNAPEYAELALKYCREGYQKSIYTSLIQELTLDYGLNSSNRMHGIIHFENTTLNAGNIPLNKHYDFKFPFQNTGKEPIIIIYVSSTCGCATPHWDKKPILPGEKGEITVTFNAEKYGNFIRSVFVQTTAQNSVERLLLRGSVPLENINTISQ